MDFKNYYYDVVFDTTSQIKQINAKRNDTGRGLRVQVVERGTIERLEHCYMLFVARKPDNTYVVLTGQPKGDYFEFKFTRQLFTASGLTVAELRLIGASGEDLGSKDFKIFVEHGVTEDILSSDDFSQLSNMIIQGANLPEIIRRAQAASTVLETTNSNITNAEAARVRAESSRVSAEQARAQAEVGRGNAERVRVQAENGRVAAEQARQSAEQSRQTAEQQRATEEAKRGRNEKLRISEENKRQLQESQRDSEERRRIRAEEERKQAETARLQTQANMSSFLTRLHEEERVRAQTEADRNTAAEAQAQKFNELTKRATSDHERAERDHTDITDKIEVIKSLEVGEFTDKVSTLEQSVRTNTEDLATVKEQQAAVSARLTEFTEAAGEVFSVKADKSELSKYTLKTDFDSHTRTATNTYATKQELNSHISSASNAYATKTELSNHSTTAANTYATKQELKQKADQRAVDTVTSRLSDFALKTEVVPLLQRKVDKEPGKGLSEPAVNNLTTSSPTAPLAAAQGAALKRLIDLVSVDVSTRLKFGSGVGINYRDTSLSNGLYIETQLNKATYPPPIARRGSWYWGILFYVGNIQLYFSTGSREIWLRFVEANGGGAWTRLDT